jgi:hypothetical protein
MKPALTSFCSAIEFTSCDDSVSYLVDYSNHTTKLKAVALNCLETDLPGLKILNSDPTILVTSAIFNDHCFKKTDSAQDEEHCECVVFPEPFDQTNWLLFVELKYHRQLGGMVESSFNKVLKTIRQFRESGLIEMNKVVYGLVSFPIVTRKPPYESSVFTFEELRAFKKREKVILVSSNDVNIYSSTHLSVK